VKWCKSRISCMCAGYTQGEAFCSGQEDGCRCPMYAGEQKAGKVKRGRMMVFANMEEAKDGE
jgi:hypothetical protein